MIIQEFGTYLAEFLSKNFNSCLETGCFAEELKYVEVVGPIYKKIDEKDKSSYRPIGLLSNLLKVYERCMLEQLYEYFNDLLSKYYCGFRHVYEAQNCLWLDKKTEKN